MKKAIWIIAILALVITAIFLQYLPDSVPMHYNAEGAIDRWGSKYENLVFPAIILVFALFWNLLISHFEKKAQTAENSKQSAEANSNAKVTKIAGICVTVLFTAMQSAFLINERKAASPTPGDGADMMKTVCVLIGAALIVLGNYMPKAKNNGAIGFRTKWSRYNDVTWAKTNRFGAIALIAAGLAAVVTAVFAKGPLALALTLAYLLAAAVVTLAYSHGVYTKERAKSE